MILFACFSLPILDLCGLTQRSSYSKWYTQFPPSNQPSILSHSHFTFQCGPGINHFLALPSRDWPTNFGFYFSASYHPLGCSRDVWHLHISAEHTLENPFLFRWLCFILWSGSGWQAQFCPSSAHRIVQQIGFKVKTMDLQACFLIDSSEGRQVFIFSETHSFLAKAGSLLAFLWIRPFQRFYNSKCDYCISMPSVFGGFLNRASPWVTSLPNGLEQQPIGPLSVWHAIWEVIPMRGVWGARCSSQLINILKLKTWKALLSHVHNRHVDLDRTH